jgi:hypothetical protein
MTYYCWRCYGENDRARGVCPHCGGEIEAPSGTQYVDRLLWAFRHPLPERRMIAAQVLGRRREHRATEELRRPAVTTDDPYLAAQALESLIAIEGAENLVELLTDRAEQGPVAVRRVAQVALDDTATEALDGRHPRLSENATDAVSAAVPKMRR